MNLLVIPHVGGSWNSLRPEAETYISMSRAGIRIVMLTDTSKDFIHRFTEAGIKVIQWSRKHKVDPSAIKAIRKTIDEYKIDIVYATYSRNISNACLACIGKPVKMVAYRGTTGGLYYYDPSSYLGLLNPRIDGIICVSHAVEDHVKNKVRRSIHPNIKTIYKGHDLAWYRNEPVAPESFGSKSEHFNVVCVANARVHKGLQYLLQAMPLVKDFKEIHLILVGNFINKEPYQSMINNSGMADRIHLPGYCDNASEVIAGCDVLVLPSLREGLPRVLLEALAYRVPVITSDNPGSMEIIDDGINGYVVPRKDPQAIAERILFLYQNPDQREKLAANAHDKLTGKLSHAQSVRNMIEYFESLLAG